MIAIETDVRSLVAEHLGADPGGLPLLTERFPSWLEINVQAGLDAYIAAEGRSATLTGVDAKQSGDVYTRLVMGTPGLPGLLANGASVAGVEYERRPSAPGEETECVKTGLFLIDGPPGPLAVWVREEGRRPRSQKAVDVLAGSIGQARAFFDELRDHMARLNRFRGQYVKLNADAFGNIEVGFERRPSVARDEVILPPGVLETIEDHAVGITARAAELVAAGRHLKRGVLLYGPPGTGKTHTIRYLASCLPDATLFVMTGSGMAWLDFIKRVVADVAPAIVVLDDVDLIAEDRDLPGMAPRQLLFSLLDAMDGLRDDADILFVCTSNRADTLEKAISARPGRIDQAVEVGRPDADCRRRLLDLYGTGLDLRGVDLDAVVEHTDGVTASFLKELMRRSWLVARGYATTAITDGHVGEALDALLDPDNPLTPELLGVDPEVVLERAKHRGSGRAWCGI